MHGVLFDLDDTLIDRQAAFQRYAADLVLRRRLEPSHVATLVECDARGYRSRTEFADDVCKRIPELGWSPAALLEDFGHLFPEFVTPDPAVRAQLDALAQGYSIGIVTNGSGQRQRAKLKAAALDDIGVFISAEVGVAKPAPEIFHTACEQLGCEVEGTWFIGDHPEHDIAGAAGVGLRTVWIRHGRDWPSSLSVQPDAIVDHVGEAFAKVP